jgi:hypothetical protein
MIWILVALGVAAAVAGGVLWRKVARPPEGESLFVFRCPECNRKLHYRSRQAGHKARCPICKKPFTFPGAPVTPEPDRRP